MDAQLRHRLECLRNCVRDDVLVEDTAQRQIGLRALDAFEQLAGAAPSTQCLEALAGAAASFEAHVGVVGAELLNLLAAEHETARESIRQLVRSQSEDARFWAISAATLERNLPTSFVEEVLRTGLTDESMKVKMSTACRVMKLGLQSLMANIIEMRTGVTEEEDAWWVDLYIDLLRDGYSIELLTNDTAPLPEFVVSMSIRLDDGTLIGWAGQEQELKAKGPAVLAKEIAQRYLEDEAKRR